MLSKKLPAIRNTAAVKAVPSLRANAHATCGRKSWGAVGHVKCTLIIKNCCEIHRRKERTIVGISIIYTILRAVELDLANQSKYPSCSSSITIWQSASNLDPTSLALTYPHIPLSIIISLKKPSLCGDDRRRYRLISTDDLHIIDLASF